MTYAGLFATAFIAATLVPAQSEALLATLLVKNTYSAAALIGVATLGNVLGSVLNWWLGGLVDLYKNNTWFPASAAQLAKAQHWYQRWGVWSLLLSWVPFIGDAITVAAGVMGTRLLPFVVIVGAAKLARYVVVAGVVWGVVG